MNSFQQLIDGFFADKISAQEYVDKYFELHQNGNAIENDAVYSTIFLVNDDYYPIELRDENDINETELKAQIKLFLENGIKKGYEIFHQYQGKNIAEYYQKQHIPLDNAVYKPLDMTSQNSQNPKQDTFTKQIYRNGIDAVRDSLFETRP